MTMTAWWPKSKENVERKTLKGDFDEAVRRQRAAAEKLKRSLDRIRPFDELADIIGQPVRVPVKKTP